MIFWSDEAIEAAVDEWETRIYRTSSWQDDIRAMLNAAMAAQGCPKLPDCKTYADRAYAEGRAEALEEAARVAWLHGDEVSVSKYDTASSAIAANRMAVNICAAIRALKEKQG